MGKFPFLPWKDLGSNDDQAVDYPDFADKVCKSLEPHLPNAVGVLICGSGQGMAIRANRFSYIRAALCWSEDTGKFSRMHNDANVLCLAGRLVELPVLERILLAFLTTDFEGGRHQKRVDKLSL